MRIKVMVVCVALAGMGCKKKGTGDGGGGGGWFVGDEGLMANVLDDGALGEGYDLGASETLHAIACRYLDEAWVAGAHGTLLYTSDAGASWQAQELSTTASLRAIATQDAGPVFVAGDGIFLTGVPARDTGITTWTQLGDGATAFRSIAAAQHGTTVLAVAEGGGIWAYAEGQLVRRAEHSGARAIAVSPDGAFAIAAGDGLARSVDGGATWSPLVVDPGLSFESVRIDDRGEALAVGADGVVARVDLDGRVLVQRVGAATLRTVQIAPWASDGRGYVAGDGGQIFLTSDWGWSWRVGPNVGRTVLGVDHIGDGHN